MKRIITMQPWWTCDNLDTLTPINKSGIAILLHDGTVEYYEDNQVIPNYAEATEDDIKALAHSRGFYFIGDTVDIVKGKLKGTSKRIVNEFKYVVPNTYGHVYTDYLVFDDGTKTNIRNCQINNVTVITKFNGFHIGGRL